MLEIGTVRAVVDADDVQVELHRTAPGFRVLAGLAGCSPAVGDRVIVSKLVNRGDEYMVLAVIGAAAALAGNVGAQGPPGPTGPAGADGLTIPTFSMAGTLAVTTGSSRWYAYRDTTITAVRASVGVAAAGAPVIVDLRRNGTSVWTATPANRPTIPVGAFTVLAGALDTPTLAAGDYLTVDVVQIGSSIAGADLTVQTVLS